MNRMKAVIGIGVGILLIAGSAGVGRAADSELKVSGFADIIFTLADQANNPSNVSPPCTDSNGNPDNCTKDKFSATGEVDFEYTNGPVVVRMDLNIPADGTESVGLVPGAPAGDIGIEQAKFEWSIPGGDPVGLLLTGGAFNAPIGFEAQDAPDLYQTSHGQLWNLVPSNLAGAMLSGGVGPVSGNVYFANEWRANNAEENSVGGLVTIAPVEFANLAVGYLTSPKHTAAAAPTVDGDGDILDVVLTAYQGEVLPEVTGLLVGEVLHDKNNDGWATVLNVMHNTPSFAHGVTFRYDRVRCEAGSAYCSTLGAPLTINTTPISVTVAGTVNLADNLSTWLEWKRFNSDVPGTKSTDLVTLEFIATFN